MKKKWILSLTILLISLFLAYNIGFQIGDFSFGKQYDEIETSQKQNIENSKFSKIFLQQNQISVINLWASWCKPCKEEMPLFQKLELDFPNMKFATLSIDKNEKDILKGIKDLNLKNDVTIENREYRKSIRNFLEKRDSNSLIKNEMVPITYIIKDGKVIYKEIGSIDYIKFKNKLSTLKTN